MNCESFQELTIVEKVELIGKVVHLIETSETSFLICTEMVEAATYAGKFDQVKILLDVGKERR